MIDAALGVLENVALGLGLAVYSVLADPGTRVYAGYAVLGALLAYAVLGRDAVRAGLLDRGAWTGPSARIDALALFLNPVLLAAGLSALVIDRSLFAGAAASALASVDLSALPGWTAFGVATVVLFVAHDFSLWAAHRTMHEVPALWAFHKFHHSAERLNPITAHRAHPVETLVSATFLAVGVGSANGALAGLFGDAVGPVELAGANAFWIAANVAGGALRHSEVPLSFGPAVEKWIVSPAMHQIHHSSAERHWNKNYGETLAVWDRLSGAWSGAEPSQRLAYGFGLGTERFRTLKGAYLEPFAEAWRALRPASKAPVSPLSERPSA